MVSETDITLERAQQLTGFSQQHIERLIKVGILKTVMGDDVRLIELASLESYSASRAEKKQVKKDDAIHHAEEAVVIGGEKFVSLNRAARLSGFTQHRIHELVKDSEIDAKHLGDRLYVSSESLFSHRRSVHAQQTKWHIAPIVKRDAPEPVTIHRVSIYNRDDAPLMPQLTAKTRGSTTVAVETRSAIHHGSIATEMHVERVSTPSPFIMVSPTKETTVRKPQHTHASEPEIKIVRHEERVVQKTMLQKIAPPTAFLMGTAVWGLAAYLAVTGFLSTTAAAEQGWLSGKILTSTEAVIQYYR